ncbi:MAG TPA: hypothetical protein VK988_20790 [Acidimicrobiales bacterium]|nr:hypothetical protein [Acidimicrobiales bacterium]
MRAMYLLGQRRVEVRDVAVPRPDPPRLLVEMRAHLRRHGTCVFCDVVARERADGLRLVTQNDAFLAFVPFAARFPY